MKGRAGVCRATAMAPARYIHRFGGRRIAGRIFGFVVAESSGRANPADPLLFHPWFGAGGAGRLQARLVVSKGRRNALWSMGAGRAKSPARGSSGKRLAMGSWGAQRLPDVAMKRPDGSMAGEGSMPGPRQWLGMQRGRSAPCQDCVVLPHTSCSPLKVRCFASWQESGNILERLPTIKKWTGRNGFG
jgi:hypothetical protein